MKHTKLTALLLAILCLTAAGCQKSNSNPDNPLAQPNNPFGDSNLSLSDLVGDTNEKPDPDKPSDSILDKWFNDSDYDADAEHGENKLYKGEKSLNRTYDGLFVSWNSHSLVYAEMDDHKNETPLCFDPTCQHWPMDEGRCAATLERYGHSTGNGPYDPTIYYDSFIIADEYDHKSSPVFYLAYKCAPHYVINGVVHERESVYCIDRYDISTGKRTVVLTGITDLIGGIWTYGDYVYFTLTDAYDYSTICRIPKAGGDVEKLGEMANVSYELLDVVDDRLYYMQDSRFICACDLTLKDNKRITALDELEGYNKDTPVVMAGAYFGYLYYYANHETVLSDSLTSKGDRWNLGTKCDLYRVPLNNLKSKPVCVVEDMLACSWRYTDDTLFYQPAVLKEVDLSKYDYDPTKIYINPINESNGTVYAMDLKTLKKTAVCKDTGMVINFRETVSGEDDAVIFTTQAYTLDAVELYNHGNCELLGTKSGQKLRVWDSW